VKEDEDIEHTEAVELPIDGILDLHTFHPGEVGDLLPEYLTACRGKGILDVRIIHGKGTGMLRETVHALLKRLPEVVSFRLAGQDAGSWGATIVRLRPTAHAQKGEKKEEANNNGSA
jgi:dsDNA-specific endonuclease/ATPase MutS2